MGLGINTTSNGGDFLPVVKYDARSGRWSRIDRSNASGTWESTPVDITKVFSAVFDLDAIQTGWIDYTAPAFALSPLGQDNPPRPNEKAKEGFRLPILLSKEAGGDVRELSSVAKTVIGAISELHDAYLEGVKGNPGMLPVVAMTDAKAVTTKHKEGSTTNYAPVLRIERWVNRPAGLKPAAAGATPGAQMPKLPPSTGSTSVAPPAAPKTSDFGSSDFG